MTVPGMAQPSDDDAAPPPAVGEEQKKSCDEEEVDDDTQLYSLPPKVDRKGKGKAKLASAFDLLPQEIIQESARRHIPFVELKI
jgi:hypothetical protein